jgi:hypothetical protein
MNTGLAPRRRRGPKRAVHLAPAMKRAVQAVVNRKLETKFVSANVLNNVSFNGTIASTAEMYSLIPPTSQGVDDYERIGDIITPTSIMTDWQFMFSQTDAQARDITVHLWVLRSKAVKDVNNYASVPITTMMDAGNGTGQQFDGTVQAAFQPLYRKAFTQVAHKKFRLTKSAGINNSTTPGTNIITQVNQSVHHVHVKFKTKKLTYTDATTLTPDNDFVFFVVGFVPNDSHAAFNGTEQPLVVNCRSSMYFKDA